MFFYQMVNEFLTVPIKSLCQLESRSIGTPIAFGDEALLKK